MIVCVIFVILCTRPLCVVRRTTKWPEGVLCGLRICTELKRPVNSVLPLHGSNMCGVWFVCGGGVMFRLVSGLRLCVVWWCRIFSYVFFCCCVDWDYIHVRLTLYVLALCCFSQFFD